MHGTLVSTEEVMWMLADCEKTAQQVKGGAHLYELYGAPSIVHILVECFPQKVAEFRWPMQNEHTSVCMQSKQHSQLACLLLSQWPAGLLTNLIPTPKKAFTEKNYNYVSFSGRQSQWLTVSTGFQTFRQHKRPYLCRVTPRRYPSHHSSPSGRMHEGGRLRLGYFQQHSHGIHLVVRGLDLCQLYQGHPQGPDISLVVVRSVFGGFAHDHFRGHPGGGAKNREDWRVSSLPSICICGKGKEPVTACAILWQLSCWHE